MSQGGHMAPEGDTLAIGISTRFYLMFYLEPLKAAKQYASFSSLNLVLGVAWGQVEGGRLRAMGHRNSLAN